MTKEKTTSESSSDDKARKTYERPTLVFYGDVREITQNVGKQGTLDGGGGSMSKTH